MWMHAFGYDHNHHHRKYHYHSIPSSTNYTPLAQRRIVMFSSRPLAIRGISYSDATSYIIGENFTVYVHPSRV